MKNITCLIIFFILLVYSFWQNDNYENTLFERARYNYQMNNMVMAEVMLKNLSVHDNRQAQGLLSSLYMSHYGFNVDEHDINALYWCSQQNRPNFLIILLGKYDFNEYNNCAGEIAKSYLYSVFLNRSMPYIRKTDISFQWLNIVALDDNQIASNAITTCNIDESNVSKSCVCKALNAESWDSEIKC